MKRRKPGKILIQELMIINKKKHNLMVLSWHVYFTSSVITKELEKNHLEGKLLF